MPMYSSSAWKPVRASAVPEAAPVPVPVAATVGGGVVAGGGVGGVGVVVGGGGGPSWSFSTKGLTFVGVQIRCNVRAPATDSVVIVPGENWIGVPTPPSRVNVPLNGPSL